MRARYDRQEDLHDSQPSTSILLSTSEACAKRCYSAHGLTLCVKNARMQKMMDVAALAQNAVSAHLRQGLTHGCTSAQA